MNQAKTTLNVRGIDVAAVRQLKAGAALRGLNLGQYLEILVKRDELLQGGDPK